MADWTKISVEYLKIMKSTNRSLFSILQTEDQFLESLQIFFFSIIYDLRDNHQYRIKMMYFFEKLSLPMMKKMISKASIMFADHSVMSIYGNYSDMVKFVMIEDNGFKRLTDELIRWK